MLDVMNSTSGAARHLDGFEATVKDFWASRPRRPSDGRKIAGVAAGIGTRYGIDPIVIRVALVALTFFGGVGPAVYLLGWLFLPGQDDEVSAFEGLLGHGRSGTSRAGAVVLCALCFPAFGLAFGGTWFDGGGIIALALVVTALYLMHRSRGHLNRPPARGPVTAAMSTAKGTPVDTTSDDWDALGADPLGWDLADHTAPPADPYRPPEAPEPPRPRRSRGGSKITLVTLALAVVTAGVGTAFVDGESWQPGHVAATTLAVLAGGLLFGAFRGGARGLIWFAAPVAVATLMLSPWPAGGYPGGVGAIKETPTNFRELQPSYERTAGTIELDLTQLPERDEPISVEASVGTGDITVFVPLTADVTFDCTARTGNAECLNRSQGGVGNGNLVGRDNGADGEGGQRFHLVLDAGIGNVEVRRHA